MQSLPRDVDRWPLVSGDDDTERFLPNAYALDDSSHGICEPIHGSDRDIEYATVALVVRNRNNESIQSSEKDIVK
jgi:hypothetical protein